MGVSAGEWMSGGGELVAGNPAIPRDLGRLHRKDGTNYLLLAGTIT